VIAVRNIGESATTVTATIPYSNRNGDTGTISLPQVSLAPGEIKLLNTSNPQLRRSDFATAGLEIRYTGAPGSMIATASSVSQSGNHVFALPMKDPNGGLSSTGDYPWFINETSATVVFIKNTTDEPQYFHLDLVYANDRRWGSNLRLLAPHQTFALDVKKIRDSQEKGIEGNTLPPDATTGHVFWSVRGKPKTLIGRAQTVDFKNGLASTYECQCTCGMSYVGAEWNIQGTGGSFPGDTLQFVVRETDRNCYSQQQSSYDVPANQVFFSTDDPSVATIDSNGLGTAEAPGQTNVRASWNTVGIVHVDFSGECWVEEKSEELTFSWDVQCRIPTGETQASMGWITVGQHRWRQTLQPTTVNWAGRRFREVSYQPSTDGCHFQDSAVHHVPLFLPTTIYTLETNQYDDMVGWVDGNAVNYYRVERPLRGLPLPCEYNDFQEVEMFCGDVPMPFVRMVLRGVIGQTTLSSWRGDQGAGRTWP
jgi:Bacterial Ig-like domain (group 2)